MRFSFHRIPLAVILGLPPSPLPPRSLPVFITSDRPLIAAPEHAGGMTAPSPVFSPDGRAAIVGGDESIVRWVLETERG